MELSPRLTWATQRLSRSYPMKPTTSLPSAAWTIARSDVTRNGLSIFTGPSSSEVPRTSDAWRVPKGEIVETDVTGVNFSRAAVAASNIVTVDPVLNTNHPKLCPSIFGWTSSCPILSRLTSSRDDDFELKWTPSHLLSTRS